MKLFIPRVKRQLGRILRYIAGGYCPGPDVKPEDWWRFHVDFTDY
jgi:hypothetical protein